MGEDENVCLVYGVHSNRAAEPTKYPTPVGYFVGSPAYAGQPRSGARNVDVVRAASSLATREPHPRPSLHHRSNTRNMLLYSHYDDIHSYSLCIPV